MNRESNIFTLVENIQVLAENFDPEQLTKAEGEKFVEMVEEQLQDIKNEINSL